MKNPGDVVERDQKVRTGRWVSLKRHSLRLALFFLATIFLAAEVFYLGVAKRGHDRELAKGLAETATINLNLINTGLLSDDRATLKDAHLEYRDTLSALKDNDYVVDEHQDLLGQLDRYDEIIAVEEDTAYLSNFRVAVVTLQKDLQSIDAKKTGAEQLKNIKEKLNDFSDKLETLKSERFAEIVSDLIEYDKKLTELIDKTSACIKTCSEKTIKSRQSDLAKLLEEYKDKLSTYDTEISHYYSPAELVESLRVLQ